MDFALRILFFLLIGGAAGALLTVAGKLFYVKTDETVEKIIEALPGANCGGCGFAGCEAATRLPRTNTSMREHKAVLPPKSFITARVAALTAV